MAHVKKSKIAASDINYYIQTRLGTLSDLEHNADVLLLPYDFLEGKGTITPHAMELSGSLIGAGFKTLMAIGPSVHQEEGKKDAAMLPHVLIMAIYRERDIRAAIADWIGGALCADSISITIVGYDASLVAYPAITYAGAAGEIQALLMS